MNARRHQRGALDLKTLQARPVFEDDVLADLRPDHDNRAKAMIEDFMIAANSVTASWLDAQGSPSIRRVLHTPKRWERIVDLAAEAGRTAASRTRRIRAADVPGPPPRGRSGQLPGSVAVGGQTAWLG